ncbi:integrase, catalytic region, zinc finger, CCHC-type containing protein [Tanacetum coccineum]
MTSLSLICLITRATSTKTWLWHCRISHLNSDTINKLAKDNLVTSLQKFKYSKDQLCPSCEQGKIKRATYKPKLVLSTVEVARTFLIFSKAPLFLWADAIAIACFSQNRSLIHARFNKTPYELINNRLPDISFLHVSGALSYPINGRKDLGKLKAKDDNQFFIGHDDNLRGYQV